MILQHWSQTFWLEEKGVNSQFFSGTSIVVLTFDRVLELRKASLIKVIYLQLTEDL